VVSHLSVAIAARHAPGMRFARLERPLLTAGLVLITIHLLDLALAGPDTSLVGVAAIVAVPALALWAQPRVTRATRFALGVTVGALFAGFGIASHGLHAVLQGLAGFDVTGLGAVVGGLLLIAGGVAALAAPGRRDRRHRVVHAALWLVGAAAFLSLVLLPLALSLMITHAPRNPVAELNIPHEDVRVPMPGGGSLAASYMPARNGTAVVLVHGSTGNRARVADRARLLARHGYGVLAIDLPGNGESDGYSNGLGDNAQPAITAALDYLEPRADRLAGFGVSLGGEVLLEAAARDPRLRAVISDGAARPEDAGMQLTTRIVRTMLRGISGMRPAPPLDGRMPHGPVLLIASGAPQEIPVNRRYAADAGPQAELWEIPEAGHTGGLRARPGEYEQRVTAFLGGAQ
jgi:pimeloyl-ACP methyl ester carboxylesterase